MKTLTLIAAMSMCPVDQAELCKVCVSLDHHYQAAIEQNVSFGKFGYNGIKEQITQCDCDSINPVVCPEYSK